VGNNAVKDEKNQRTGGGKRDEKLIQLPKTQHTGSTAGADRVDVNVFRDLKTGPVVTRFQPRKRGPKKKQRSPAPNGTDCGKGERQRMQANR